MEAVAVLGGAGVRRNLAGLVPVAYSPPLPFGPAYAGLAGEELLWGCDGGRGAARGGAGWVSGGPRLATSRGGAAGSVGPAGGSPHWPPAAVSKAIFPVTLLPLALGAVAAGVWLGGRGWGGGAAACCPVVAAPKATSPAVCLWGDSSGAASNHHRRVGVLQPAGDEDIIKSSDERV